MVSSHATVQLRSARDAVFALWLLGWALFIAPACAPPPIQYVYDSNGRLVAALDPSQDGSGGGTAIYSYDGAGNLTGITRAQTTALEVISFAPDCGVSGTTVTIYGSGFSTTASNNTVNFPGGTAAATSATANQLMVPVPSGATGSGKITVTVGGVTSPQSPQNFTVGCGAPTITDLRPSTGGSCATKPLAARGALLSILGTNFDTAPLNDRTVVNLAFAQVGPPNANPTTTRIDVNVPQYATSGKVFLSTPVAPAPPSPCDLFIPPKNNDTTPPTDYATTQVDLTDSGRMGNPTIAPTPYTVTMPTNPNFALTLFDGIQGDRACFEFTNVNIAFKVVAQGPDGSNLWTAYDTGRFVDAFTLPTTGTYTLVAQSGSGTSGTVTYNLYHTDADSVRSVATGSPGSQVPITSPCQNAYLRFPGTAGHRASAIGSPSACPSSWVLNIFDVDGTTLLAHTGYNDCVTGTFLETDPNSALNTTGTYTLLFDPQDVLTGTFTITIYDIVDVPPVSTTIGAQQAVTVTNTTPGQNARVTFPFTGTSSQQVTVTYSKHTNSAINSNCVDVSLLPPGGGTPLARGSACSNDSPSTLTATLMTQGTYTIFIDPELDNLSSVTVSVQ